MNKLYLQFFSLLILCSCQTQQEKKTTEKESSQDTLAPMRVTVIADLHDSLQPKTFFLDKMPAPKVVAIPKSGGITKMLPVLQNEKGEPILDKDGNTFILGEGGISNFTNFTTDNGLALDFVSCSIMDKTGHLWFGTWGGGVSRYDGKSFMSFTTAQGLTNNVVYSIAEDKAGNLWFGTDGGGVSRYDGTTLMSFTTAQGLANNKVYSITEDKAGNLWFGTWGGGVSRYDGKSFMSFTTAQGLTNNVVRSITEDKAGNLWFGTNGGGVSRYDGTTFMSFTTAQGLTNNVVYSIAEDKTGNLWFGTDGDGVSRYDGTTFMSFTTAQGLANNTVWSITEDKTGNLWFGTDGGGVSRYDGKSFTSFTTAQGLANNVVRSITEDKAGNLWFGSNVGGASRYDGKTFVSFTTAQGLANNTVWSILEDKTGNLWFGTYGGVSRYNGKSFSSFTTAQGLANNTVWSILEDKTGNLWLGTNGGGVSCYDGKTFVSFTTAQGLANNAVWSSLEDKTGNLWFGTDGGGVSRYNGKSFTSFTTAQGLANNQVFKILEDKTGNLWFGTNGGGVSRYDGKTFVSFTTAQGLANNNVFSILEDKAGNLWFGTSGGGVSRYDGKSFTSFTTAQGLANNVVYDIVEDKQGNIVIGTNLGFTLIPAKASALPFSDIKAELEYYNSPNGDPINDINSNAMLCDSKGIIWAGTGSEKTALVRFDYAALHKNKLPPSLVIQSVKVNDENISWYDLSENLKEIPIAIGREKSDEQNSITTPGNIIEEVGLFKRELTPAERDSMWKRFGSIQFDSITKFYPLPENLVLPYLHNHISFEFAAIETSRPFLVKYQYMLEGYDKVWSPVTNRSNASFGNINEGTYSFKLKAQGANGVWTEPITYTFKVLPPWYRTWWAYFIYALLFLAALRVFIKWRERHLRAEKEKLEKTVEERTEELVQKNILVEEQKTVVEKEKQRSDDLLLNILPEEVAEELKAKGSAEAKQFDEVTVLFTDFQDFTQLSEKMTAKELVEEIHTCFMAFDNIMEKYGIEKIKTIGDSYMCAGGLPVANKTHAADVVSAGLDIQQDILNRIEVRTASGKEPFQIRIGIHTGPVVAGIVGIKKFAYDIWGNTVNIASRMESSGEAGKVNISGTTYQLVKDKFNCTYRGKIQAKNKGELDMYFVEGKI